MDTDRLSEAARERLRAQVRTGILSALTLAGENVDRPGLHRTPARWLAAWEEMTASPGDPDTLLAVVFDDAGPVDQMVVIGPTPFSSLCEHHLMPFTGHAWVGYIPDGGVVGLSKLPRLVEHYARRVQVQERLTNQVGAAIDKRVPNLGTGVVIRAKHTCASQRGIRKPAPMSTSYLSGLLRDDLKARDEFLALTRA